MREVGIPVLLGGLAFDRGLARYTRLIQLYVWLAFFTLPAAMMLCDATSPTGKALYAVAIGAVFLLRVG